MINPGMKLRLLKPIPDLHCGAKVLKPGGVYTVDKLIIESKVFTIKELKGLNYFTLNYDNTTNFTFGTWWEPAFSITDTLSTYFQENNK